MEFLLVVIIAISLSMDAFSISLAYGTLKIEKNKQYIISMTVGIFHFIMPLIGLIVGNKVISIFKIRPEIIIFIILVVIGIEMVYETFKKKETIKIMHKLEILLFAFAVSIDSFSVGITLAKINKNYLLSALMFALTSFIFTLIGLKLGNKIETLIGKMSTVIGGIILIIIGISYII